MNRFYDPMMGPLVEGIDPEKYVIATYMVGADPKEDIIVKAGSIAVEQTTGSWDDVPEETDDVRANYAAKVVGVYAVPDFELQATVPKDTEMRYYVLRLAYPWVNFYDNIPLMLGTVIGNISSLPYLKLLDLDFPASFVKQFKGPKFGIKGIRDILGVYDRPLLNNMIKPCTGFPPEVGAKLCYEAAAGGVDIIKDDELISNPSFSHIEDRVKLYMEAIKKADSEKKEKTLYSVNITSEVADLTSNALKAIKGGAEMLLVNIFGTGLSGVRMLAENPEINVPIMAHVCTVGAVASSPYSGIAWPLLTKLIRLVGADTMLLMPPYGKFDNLKEKYIRSVQTCTSKFYDIKPALPFLGGGLIQGMLPELLDDCGNDMLIGVGAGIHAHPMGPKAGAKAFRQAITATMNGESLQKAAEKHEELKAALVKYGVVTADNAQKKLYAI